MRFAGDCRIGSGDEFRLESRLNILSVVGLEVGSSCRPVVLTRSSQDRLERGHRRRIKLTLNGLGEPESGDSTRHCISIRAV